MIQEHEITQLWLLFENKLFFCEKNSSLNWRNIKNLLIWSFKWGIPHVKTNFVKTTILWSKEKFEGCSCNYNIKTQIFIMQTKILEKKI